MLLTPTLTGAATMPTLRVPTLVAPTLVVLLRPAGPAEMADGPWTMIDDGRQRNG